MFRKFLEFQNVEPPDVTTGSGIACQRERARDLCAMGRGT